MVVTLGMGGAEHGGPWDVGKALGTVTLGTVTLGTVTLGR
jgi:hypothetical protein